MKDYKSKLIIGVALTDELFIKRAERVKKVNLDLMLTLSQCVCVCVCTRVRACACVYFCSYAL